MARKRGFMVLSGSSKPKVGCCCFKLKNGRYCLHKAQIVGYCIQHYHIVYNGKRSKKKF